VAAGCTKYKTLRVVWKKCVLALSLSLSLSLSGVGWKKRECKPKSFSRGFCGRKGGLCTAAGVRQRASAARFSRPASSMFCKGHQSRIGFRQNGG